MKHGGDIYRNPVKFDFSVNINPLGIPERVREALTQAVSECTHYPDMEAEELLQAIGRMTGGSTEFRAYRVRQRSVGTVCGAHACTQTGENTDPGAVISGI